ncbi:MAG TPA: PHP domain-containing protein [Rhodothermales bacterium]
MSDARTMAAAAAANGVDTIAFTEHAHHLSEVRETIAYLASRWMLEGRPLARQAYLDAVSDARDVAPIEVRVGLELDARPQHDDYERALEQVVDPSAPAWDVIVGSVHALSDDSGIEETRSVDEPMAVWRDYAELQVAAMASGRYDVLAHPVRLGFSVAGRPPNLSRMLDEITRAAVRHGVAVEVNGNDMSVRPDLVAALIASIARQGAWVSLGSDAHVPATAGAALRAVPVLRRHGLDCAAIFRRRRPELVPLPSRAA